MSKTGATPLIELLSHAKGQKVDERREGQRESLVTPAEFQAVTEDLITVGQRMEAVTRDVSTSGIGLITSKVPEADRVALQLTIDGEQKTLLCFVKWTEPSGPFVFVGLDVIRTLEKIPSATDSFTSLSN